jgi:ribosomal-protein-alanine N-acetyltransferase
MLRTDFHPFHELETARLFLRRITMDDAGEIFFLRSNEIILQFINKEPATTIKDAEDFIKRINDDIDAGEVIMWAITLKDNPGKLIGTICFWRLQKENYRAEIGYVLHPGFWKKGIMKEAILKAIEYGFTEMRLHSIEVRINPNNNASAAILKSTGFVQEAYFKEDFFSRILFLTLQFIQCINNQANLSTDARLQLTVIK